LDFNQAYNPPCAFNPYTTCPISMKENRLPMKILAAERAYPVPDRCRRPCLRLGGDSNVIVQELGGEIRAVRPHQSTELVVDLKLTEDGRIPQRLEDRTIQFPFEIDLAGRTIAKSEPDDEAADVACLDDVVVHRSLQRRDAAEGLPLARSIPVLQQSGADFVIPIVGTYQSPTL
jgi:hypothetical protein